MLVFDRACYKSLEDIYFNGNVVRFDQNYVCLGDFWLTRINVKNHRSTILYKWSPKEKNLVFKLYINYLWIK